MKHMSKVLSTLFVVCILIFARGEVAFAESYSLPAEEMTLSSRVVDNFDIEAIGSRAKESTVLNTYRVYTGLLNGEAVADVVYAKTYKQLRFTNSYVQRPSVLTGIDLVDMSGTYIPELGGVAVSGSIEYWTCQYQLI